MFHNDSDKLGPVAPIEDDQDRMIATSEQEILERQEELMAMDAAKLAKEVVVKAIAHEERKSRNPRVKMNLPGLAAMLKLLMSMEGVEKASERDIEVELPNDTGHAIDKLLELRQKGQLKSLQMQDLSSLIEKRKEWKELSKVREMLEEIEATAQASQIKQQIVVKTREEVDSEKSSEEARD